MRHADSDMCSGPLLGKIIRYTLPIVFTGLLQLLFNAADLVVVGRFCGSVSVAAVGATGSIINLIVNLFIGLSVGAGVTVAQDIGAGKWDGVYRTIHTAMAAALVSGAVLTVTGLLSAEFFLELMGTPEDVIGLSTLYMRIYFCGILSSMVYNFGAAILRAAGNTKGPLVYLTMAGVVNVVFNLIFVVVFHMDVAGVALATAISQTLAAALVVLALTRRGDSCQLWISKIRFHKSALLRIARIGVPAGIQSSLFSISNVIIQSSINAFGSVVMSGNAAASNIEGFLYTSLNAFYQTALNFTGQNYGARQYKRIHRITMICLTCVLCGGSVVAIIAAAFARPLLSIYITDSADSISYGVLRLTYVCTLYFLCGLMEVMTGVLRGMGASLVTMFISLVGICGIRIIWIFTIFQMPQYHNLPSLYISYPISWLFTFAAQVVVYIVLYSSIRRKNPEASPPA